MCAPGFTFSEGVRTVSSNGLKRKDNMVLSVFTSLSAIWELRKAVKLLNKSRGSWPGGDLSRALAFFVEGVMGRIVCVGLLVLSLWLGVGDKEVFADCTPGEQDPRGIQAWTGTVPLLLWIAMET